MYGSVVWDNCGNVAKQSVLGLQKRAARIILNADRKTCQQILPVRLQYSMSPRNVYNFQNCQVTFNTAGNNCTQASSTLAQTKRPLKRCILYSDSDSD